MSAPPSLPASGPPPASGVSLPASPRMRLGEYLVAKGLVSPQARDAALAEQQVTQEKLGLILTRNGFLTRKALLQAILDTNPERLHGEQFFTARVPGEFLIRDRKSVV